MQNAVMELFFIREVINAVVIAAGAGLVTYSAAIVITDVKTRTTNELQEAFKMCP